MLTITRDELNAMLEQAAEKGARAALQGVGLHDEKDPAAVAKDLFEIRDLLDAYRTVKRATLTAFGKAIAVLIIGGLLLWLGKPGLLFLVSKS